MSQIQFYPYATAANGVWLTMRSKPELPDLEGRSWPLYELDEWQELTLQLEVRLDRKRLEEVLPAWERAEPPCQVIVLIWSVSSRQRGQIALEEIETREEITLFRGEQPLRRRDLYGSLTIEPALVRTRRAPDQAEGYAGQLGDRLAWGPPYELHVDPPPQPVPGGTLSGRWEKFAESDDEWLKRHRGDLFALKIGAEPELLLNDSVTGLRKIIEHTARRGKRTRVQKATLDTLAVGVWQSLAGASIGALQIAVRDAAEEPLERLLPWQRGTLDRIAPRLYPTLNRSDALIRLIDELASNPTEALAVIHARLFSAAQSLADSRRAFDGLLRVAEDRPA